MPRTCRWPESQITLADLAVAARFVKAFRADELAGLEVLGRGGVLELAVFFAVLLRLWLV